MFVIKFHSTSLPANIQIHICVQRCPSSVLCYSLSSCPDTCNCVLLAIAKVALPISPWQLLPFLSSLQISQQPFLSFISSALPDWYNDHDFRHCGSDNEKLNLQRQSVTSISTVAVRESFSERKRENTAPFALRKGWFVCVVSLALPPPLQCSAVQCTSACQCCTNGLGAATGSFSHVACWQWCGTHGVRGGSVAASASVRF